MHKNTYVPKKEKIEISAVKILIIAVTILGTFVIPAQAISNFRRQSDNLPVQTVATATPEQGRVAGESTEKSSRIVTIPVINARINMDSEVGHLVLVGFILLFLGFVTLSFLVVDNYYLKKNIS